MTPEDFARIEQIEQKIDMLIEFFCVGKTAREIERRRLTNAERVQRAVAKVAKRREEKKAAKR